MNQVRQERVDPFLGLEMTVLGSHLFSKQQ